MLALLVARADRAARCSRACGKSVGRHDRRRDDHDAREDRAAERPGRRRRCGSTWTPSRGVVTLSGVAKTPAEEQQGRRARAAASPASRTSSRRCRSEPEVEGCPSGPLTWLNPAQCSVFVLRTPSAASRRGTSSTSESGPQTNAERPRGGHQRRRGARARCGREYPSTPRALRGSRSRPGGSAPRAPAPGTRPRTPNPRGSVRLCTRATAAPGRVSITCRGASIGSGQSPSPRQRTGSWRRPDPTGSVKVPAGPSTARHRPGSSARQVRAGAAVPVHLDQELEHSPPAASPGAEAIE